MKHAASILLFVLAVLPLSAAPPALTLPPEVSGDVGAFTAVKASTDGKAVKFVALDSGLNLFPAGLLSDPTATVVTASRPGRFRLLAYTGNADGPSEPATCVVIIGGAPPVPPPSPTPDPAPEPSPPVPVKAFRVFLIYESETTLTAPQRAVLFGKVVEDYLTANCTGGVSGWRRRDKDSPGEADKSMAALWSAVQPKLTGTPCVAIAVNEKVTIEPLPATPAAAVDLLKKYREGR